MSKNHNRLSLGVNEYELEAIAEIYRSIVLTDNEKFESQMMVVHISEGILFKRNIRFKLSGGNAWLAENPNAPFFTQFLYSICLLDTDARIAILRAVKNQPDSF